VKIFIAIKTNITNGIIKAINPNLEVLQKGRLDLKHQRI